MIIVGVGRKKWWVATVRRKKERCWYEYEKRDGPPHEDWKKKEQAEDRGKSLITFVPVLELALSQLALDVHQSVLLGVNAETQKDRVRFVFFSLFCYLAREDSQ